MIFIDVRKVKSHQPMRTELPIHRKGTKSRIVVLAGAALLGWLIFRTHEARLIGPTKLVINDVSGDRIDVRLSEITVHNDNITNISLIKCSSGVYWVPETFAWVSNGIGDRCFETTIRVHPPGFHPCEVDIGLCTAETVPKFVVDPIVVEFELSHEASNEESKAVMTNARQILSSGDNITDRVEHYALKNAGFPHSLR